MKPRDPYDISTWGPACGRGIQYKDMGPVTDGQKGAIRKISTGRKHRGMASDSQSLGRVRPGASSEAVKAKEE